MGDVSSWIGIGLTALAISAGCVAYIHAQINVVHARTNAVRDWAENKISEAKRELETEVAVEREDRRRELDKFGDVLEGFRAVGTAVIQMTEGIKHLGERFDDHRVSTDRSFEEIKHSMRNLDMKVQSLPGAQIAAKRVRAKREDTH